MAEEKMPTVIMGDNSLGSLGDKVIGLDFYDSTGLAKAEKIEDSRGVRAICDRQHTLDALRRQL